MEINFGHHVEKTGNEVRFKEEKRPRKVLSTLFFVREGSSKKDRPMERSPCT